MQPIAPSEEFISNSINTTTVVPRYLRYSRSLSKISLPKASGVRSSTHPPSTIHHPPIHSSTHRTIPSHHIPIPILDHTPFLQAKPQSKSEFSSCFSTTDTHQPPPPTQPFLGLFCAFALDKISLRTPAARDSVQFDFIPAGRELIGTGFNIRHCVGSLEKGKQTRHATFGRVRQGYRIMMEDFLRGMQQSTLTTSVLFATPTSIPIIAAAQEALRDTLQQPTSLQRAAAAVATSTSSDNVQLKSSNDSTINGVVIGLLSSFGSAILIAFIFLIVYFFKYTSSGRILLDRIGRPGEYDDEQAFAKEEAEALEEMDDLQRTEYLRAKAFVQSNPPDSLPTDISLSQYLAIQEKGVSAWEFEPELEIANCFVEARTEIEFFDSECCTLTNLPVPKQNEVYYWESKIYDKPENTLISIGVATKPYPLFRLPGWHKYSVAYTSTGHRRYNQPFSGPVYGPQYVQGDVIGVGYRPRTGTIFFTRNGKKLEDVAHGLKSQNLFPAVGANGPCTVHVNFGQSGFVFIEANVKKWGLAPMTGSLAPPPPYGSEQGSILLEAGREGAQSSNGHYQPDPRHGRTRSGNFRHGPPTSPGPIRSPTDISLAQLTHFPSHEEPGEASNSSTPAPTGGVTQQSGLGVHDNAQPPPEYTSPLPSAAGSPRGSTDSERTPMLRRKTTPPPIPSYNDAVAQRNRSHSHRDRSGGRRERSDSHRARQGDGNPSQS